MKPEDRWHGLTLEQWQNIWDTQSWKARVVGTLRGVALCKDADVADRIGALEVLNNAVIDGVLPVDYSYAELVRDVLLSISRGERGKWWRGKRYRRAVQDRLLGARYMLRTARQFTVTQAEMSGGTSGWDAVKDLLS